MMKSLIAASLVAELLVPSPKLYIPPKPAIIKPANIELTKHKAAITATINNSVHATNDRIDVIQGGAGYALYFGTYC